MFELTEVSDHGLTLYTERTDGTGGFPGNLKIWISYHLEETGAYEISYKVTTDQDTLVNPTNHSYFNLSGDFTQTIDRHVFQLNTEVFTQSLPTVFLQKLQMQIVMLSNTSTMVPC